MFQKSKILKFLGGLLVICVAIPVQAKSVFIEDLFNNGVPKVEDAYQQILNVNSTRGYDYNAEIWCSTSDNITITANLVYDEVADYAAEYLLFFSPYRVENIRNGDSFVDQSKIIMKKSFIQNPDTEVLFTLSSEDIDMNQDYYGFIVPLDMYDLIGTPTKEIYFNMSNNICSYDNDLKFITLKPGLNTFSTPANLKSVEFSNFGYNIRFAKMEKGQWTGLEIGSKAFFELIQPLEGYLVRNNGTEDVIMKMEYDADNSDSLLLSKDLDAGWNFLGVTKTNNPFTDIANTTATMILDLTNGGKTNLVQLGKTFLQATKFMLGKAYAVFVNSQGTYGGINNYGDDNSCKGMDEANIHHTFENGVITLRWDVIDGDKVQIALFDPNGQYWKSLGSVNMSAGQYSYTVTWEGEHNFLLTNGCKEIRYKVDANTLHSYSQELTEAYERAYENGIISESSIDKAHLYNAFSNLELADIMNKFSENVLGYVGDTSLYCDFEGLNSVESAIITKTCQLRLLGGAYSTNAFSLDWVYGITTRAQFGTILSRALWGYDYEGGSPYYIKHLTALVSAGIMTQSQINNAAEINEIKGYVLIILKKAADYYSSIEIDCNDPMIVLACTANTDACPEECRNDNPTYSQEFTDAYSRAYENGIISESPIDNANLYDALTNASTEAILLNFATYLGLDSDSIASSFGNLFIDEGLYVNRANFGTALSRILWQNQYEGGSPFYYSYHLNALKSAGIIAQIDNPTETIEIKGYILLALMRASEIFIPERVNCNDPIAVIACIIGGDACPASCMVDCDDPLVVLACSDPENYEECPQICRNSNHIYSEELTTAYNWAYSKSIVTDATIDDANLYDSITRAELAKMLANWAKDLGMTPDTSLDCDFTDTTSVVGDLYDAIIEACQLGLMGQGATVFRPHDTMSKAEYFAILSKALWGTQYEGGIPYYTNHMNALESAGIINQTNNPEGALTLKGYVLLTLKRASNSNNVDLDL